MAEFIVGESWQYSPLVRRVLAPNAGIMTAGGTNTWLVGQEEVAVIDPGPSDAPHIDAILRAAGADTIKWILCTHTHRDHSPGAAKLKAATGAQVIGLPPPGGLAQDESFAPDHCPAENECLRASNFTLQTIYTPGHASNHVCFLLQEEGVLFTGDHIMQGSTVVIAPPDGDMADYIQSLEKLKSLPLQSFAPGHGELVCDPFPLIDSTIAHRLKREAKVWDALVSIGTASPASLVEQAYQDTPKFLHGLARFSLEAHLIKLEKEGKVSRSGMLWSPIL
ncbi:MAG TPA: MBL fold metallo-hydrolase [Pseudomonadales bacterium]|nr:MBL fold metallo-hydrolase [Pseudomonadales bacterium]